MKWERIFSNYMDRRGGDSFSTTYGEKLMEEWPFSEPGGKRRGDESRFWEAWKVERMMRKSFNDLV